MILFNPKDSQLVTNKQGHFRYQNFNLLQWEQDCFIKEPMDFQTMKLIVQQIIVLSKRYWILSNQKAMMNSSIHETFLENKDQKVLFKEKFKLKMMKLRIYNLRIIRIQGWINSHDYQDEHRLNTQRVMMKWTQLLNVLGKSKWSIKSLKWLTNRK